MKEFLSESIIDSFNGGPMEVTKGDFVRTPVTGVKLRRSEELDLIFELTSRGWNRERPERYPAGTVRTAHEVIEFHHAAGWIGIARGVIERDWRSSTKGEGETVETYSAHSVELDLQRQIQPTYIIEWVLNIPDGFAWTEPVRFSTIETFAKSVGSGDAEIRMTGSSESGGGNKALHIRTLGVDLYVMCPIDRDDNDKNAGQIVYGVCPDQTFRDKVRTCLSFILGKPIVYLGHTEYCSEWIPTFMRSVDAFSADGAFFKLYDLPPYPINDIRYTNVIDQKLVTNRVNALLEKFDAISFNKLSWSYWYAVCAPIHTAALHFGSLIEQLQNNSSSVIGTPRKLLDDEAWGSLNCAILNWLKTADIDLGTLPILKGKISSLNQAPQNLVLKRLLDIMGLRITDVEMDAWKHRNMAAHGRMSDNGVELILNSKLLRLLFHRMLAGITHCSDRYIDYYNLGHPVRPLTEAVPGR